MRCFHQLWMADVADDAFTSSPSAEDRLPK
jgi:hypothetical protein